MGENVAFRSYLTHRKQYICINNDIKTNEQKVTCGVTQGSFLGPVIFNIHKWSPSNSNLLNTIMFTDDTNLIFGTQRHKRSFFDSKKRVAEY